MSNGLESADETEDVVDVLLDLGRDVGDFDGEIGRG